MSIRSAMAPRRVARLAHMAPSQIREMMRVATQKGAINLAQGRPDFQPAPEILNAAIAAMQDGHNQYSMTWGIPELRAAVAHLLRTRYGVVHDPETDITIGCGVTEVMMAVILATIEDGDEAVIIEPAHENYAPAIRLAGGVPRYVSLVAPDFELDLDQMAAVVNDRTRLIIVNTPHNPTGRVFNRAQLTRIGEIAAQHDAWILTDEIYDYLTYDGSEHVAPASLPGMAERTITTGGISKIHSVTGWRLGYVAAPTAIATDIRTVHDYLTICAPTPLQHAAVVAMGMPDSYFQGLVVDYQRRRDRMMEILARTGFVTRAPKGAYYAMASYEAWGFAGNSQAFAKHLIDDAGIATVPGTAFYPGRTELGERLVRFAFAKTMETLDEVESRLIASFGRRA